jgi:hypothetical protein
MGLPTAYLITTKNLEGLLSAIKTAKAPERLNSKFLTNLEFASSNDRLFIGVLKALGFTDDSGVPTRRYFEFLDQSRSGAVLAESLREAYGDLFAVNTKAQELSVEEVKNRFRTLTQGQYSDNVLGLMAKTFKSIADLADWQAPKPSLEEVDVQVEHVDQSPRIASVARIEHHPKEAPHNFSLRELHYNIQIILPETRDVAVFDALFESLKKHLLN